MSNIKNLKNYTIVEEKYIEDVNGTGYVLCHNKTKARVLLIENDDDNKVFNIGFRTPPYDDSGIPHIMEHSVLCGSRKYPVKDPFVELAKGSLNTFLNAMTYSDKTVYPLASCNIVDFENLMKVYLDAVFYPNIYTNDKIMKQEGWHYELEAVDGELKYNGVVFNEMKGVFSSAEQMMYRAIERSLLPDTAYGFESGGDPAAIPTLSQERFLDFHRAYYHPSNSYIYLYGDMDMAKELDYIDKEYLCNYEYQDIDSFIKPQKPFEKFREVTEAYSISENESEADNTFLTYNVVAGSSLDKQKVTALGILEYALMDAPGAPLKKALVEAELGEDVFSSYDNGIAQTIFSIVVKGGNASDKDKFVNIIRNTLSGLAGHKEKSEKLNKLSVLAAINNFEFKHKEGNFGRFPKGLMLGLDAFNSWLYEDDSALTFFQMNDVYKTLKNLTQTDYFEKLIDETFLNNTFGSIVMLVPDKKLAEQMQQKEQKILADYKATLEKDELEQLVSDTKTLADYQSMEDSPEDMAKVPLLSIGDIEKKAKPLTNEVDNISGVPVIRHNLFTNGIGYLEFCFKINHIEEKYLPYVALLTEIFKYVDTESHSYGDLSNEINFHTGGIGFSSGIFHTVKDQGQFSYFSVKTKALFEKMPMAIKLIEEILYESKLGDTKRLKEIITETRSGLKSDLTSSGHMTTAMRAMSYISQSMAFKEKTEGIDFYMSLCQMDDDFSKMQDTIIDSLKVVLREILNVNNLTISFTGDQDVHEYDEAINHFISLLSKDGSHNQERKIATSIKNEGFKTASQVQYVAMAGDFRDAGYEFTGALNVLQIIFSYDYLWINVRVKGGAYGGMCSFTKSGLAYLTSYRDPNLMETYEVYKKAVEYVEKFDCDEMAMTKYLIGAIAKLDAPMTPSAEGGYSFLCYLSGITDEIQQKERDEILSTDVNAIRALAPIVKSITESGIICAIGGENKIQAAKDNFKEVRSEF